jgi:hypothetical protein
MKGRILLSTDSTCSLVIIDVPPGSWFLALLDDAAARGRRRWRITATRMPASRQRVFGAQPYPECRRLVTVEGIFPQLLKFPALPTRDRRRQTGTLPNGTVGRAISLGPLVAPPVRSADMNSQVQE